MKKLLPLFFLPVALIVCFFPCLARAQPQGSQTITPPQLLAPENGSVVNGNPEFFWTPAVHPRGFKGAYKLRIVNVSTGQSPVSAMASNPLIYQNQIGLRRQNETFGGSLLGDRTYAWCIQVVDENGNPTGENQGLSEVFTFTCAQAPQSPPPVSPTSDENVIEIDMGPLVMTGIRNDAPPEPARVIEIDMGPLVMTGIRNDAPPEPARVIEIDMGPLVMTGIRTGQAKPPVGGGKTPVKSKVQEDLKKKLERKTPETDDGNPPASRPPEVKEAKQKLDLPFKKPGTVEGAQPPAEPIGGAQIKQGAKGKAVGDTAVNRLSGQTPSLKTLPVPEKPAEDAVKLPLQQKIGTKRTTEDVAGEKKTAPVIQPAGTK
jgi:hypothetical protein